MSKKQSIRKPRFEHRVEQILSQRESLMAEIAMRTRLGSVTPLIVKARALLTRFWADADWQAREEMLPIARWLLQLGAAQPALAQDSTKVRRRKARKAPAARLSR